MAKQDFYNVENEDRGTHIPAEQKPARPLPEELINPADKIKNAHATGTGAMGRNESSLPEEDNGNQPGKAY